MKKLTQEEALLDCIKAWGNTYDYSKMTYNGYTGLIKIGCRVHGWFWKHYNNHITGQGCPKCAKISKDMSCRSTVDKLIIRANNKHKNKYDYSLITEEIYKNQHEKYSFICPLHGIFKQSFRAHLAGQGCPKCFTNNCLTYDAFVQKAILKHKNKYDYSEVIYINNHTKVKIKCVDCDEYYFQTPNDHLDGCGCPRCKINKGESLIEMILKNNNIKFEMFKSYKNCCYKLPLRFDFYIPDKNILIEFDGWQHFFANDYFGGEESFILQEIKDEIKNKYAEDNNISLIRIPYWLLDNPREIEEIILNDIHFFSDSTNTSL
jgi:hypothetical protein